MAGARAEHVAHRPRGPLAGLVTRAVGYDISGLAPGIHIGMPSTSLTLVIPLDEPITVTPPGGGDAHALATCLGGLHTAPAHIHHSGTQRGLQLDLAPSAARALFGVPAGEVAMRTVELADAIGSEATRLRERLHEAPTWAQRFALVEAALGRRVDGRARCRPEVVEAWRLIGARGGTVPVSRVARHVGWSVRHLQHAFVAETGMTPKEVCLLRRFERSRVLVRDPSRPLAEVAAACGYSDQAHLARDWRRFAGMSASHWRQADELAFVQAEGASDAPS